MKKILYIEDEEQTIYLIREILKEYDVIAVKNVQDAIDILKIKKFDLIILDLRLTPEEQLSRPAGMKILEFLKNKKANVIILSALSDEAYKAKRKYKNVKGVIVKPFRIKELRALVEKFS